MISFKRSSARKRGEFYHLTNKICIFYFFFPPSVRIGRRSKVTLSIRRFAAEARAGRALEQPCFLSIRPQRRRGRLQRARSNESNGKLLISAISILPPSLLSLARAHSRFPISADLYSSPSPLSSSSSSSHRSFLPHSSSAVCTVAY